MRVLITGADQPLGALVASGLAREHALRLTGSAVLAPGGFEMLEYTPADLREPSQVAPLTAGMEAVVHLAPYGTGAAADSASERELLDQSARGTFVLLHEALKAGVRRVVLASRLELMAAYPEDHLVTETWQPQPEATAAALAPYMAELALREFVRAEEMTGVCLRFGPIGSRPDGTTPADAVAAIGRALTMDAGDRKYRWWIYHICSTERYALGAAADPPLSFSRST